MSAIGSAVLIRHACDWPQSEEDDRLRQCARRCCTSTDGICSK